MTAYPKMTAEERKAEYAKVTKEYEDLKARGLKLNMARGKPGKAQLDLVSDIFSLMQKPEDYVSDGIDVRNYGELSGLPAAKRLFAEILGCRPEQVFVGGVLEHIEMAGIHSGDSACCTPPFALSEAVQAQLRAIARRLALRLGVVGLINIQFAIKDQVIYIIEANPRASRTVPFASKATGVPLAKVAARIMAGEKLADLGMPPDDRRLEHFSVKEAVMPFGRFPGADTVLGPEMKSTGEVMGIASNFPEAFAKTQLAISYALPEGGTVFVSVCDRDKRAIVPIARDIARLGFQLVATGGTARALKDAGVPVTPIDDVTQFPEMMDGRVKTLHPRVHGGLLAKRDNEAHMAQAAEHGIEMIDMVVVNLYAFEKTVESGADFGTCIENIDIGGPSMLRSAAKNFESVAVVTRPASYDAILAEMRANDGATLRDTRAKLALDVFQTTAAYDGAIAAWMGAQLKDEGDVKFPADRTLHLSKVQDLRYGENPHQSAAFYRRDDYADAPHSLAHAKQHQGKELSYNCLLYTSDAADD